MKCSLGISNCLEEISSLSHSVVFLYFFAWIAEEGFLSLLAILWNSAFKCLFLSFSPLLFAKFSLRDWQIQIILLPPKVRTFCLRERGPECLQANEETSKLSWSPLLPSFPPTYKYRLWGSEQECEYLGKMDESPLSQGKNSLGE